MKESQFSIRFCRISIVAPSECQTQSVDCIVVAVCRDIGPRSFLSVGLAKTLLSDTSKVKLETTAPESTASLHVEWAYLPSDCTSTTSFAFSDGLDVDVILSRQAIAETTVCSPSYGPQARHGTLVQTFYQLEVHQSTPAICYSGRKALDETKQPRAALPQPMRGQYPLPAIGVTPLYSYQPYTVYIQDAKSYQHHKPRPNPEDLFDEPGSAYDINYDWADPDANPPPIPWDRVQSYRDFTQSAGYKFWKWDPELGRWKHRDPTTGIDILCPVHPD